MTLVDTDGQGVDRIDATGVWANGQHYEVDCIVFASGFEVGTDLSRRSGFQIIGTSGSSLEEYWAQECERCTARMSMDFQIFSCLPPHRRRISSRTCRNYVEASDAIAAVVAHAEEIGAATVEAGRSDVDAWLQQIQRQAR